MSYLSGYLAFGFFEDECVRLWRFHTQKSADRIHKIEELEPVREVGGVEAVLLCASGKMFFGGHAGILSVILHITLQFRSDDTRAVLQSLQVIWKYCWSAGDHWKK
jgi:hypothetical protein